MEINNPRKKIIEYLRKNLKKGYTIASLKFALINQGYTRTLVERAVQDLEKELAETAPVLKEKPKIVHQIIDEHDRPVKIQKSWLKRIFD
jgi:hypothetical protein